MVAKRWIYYNIGSKLNHGNYGLQTEVKDWNHQQSSETNDITNIAYKMRGRLGMNYKSTNFLIHHNREVTNTIKFFKVN